MNEPRTSVIINEREVSPEAGTMFKFLLEETDSAIMDPVNSGDEPFIVHPIRNADLHKDGYVTPLSLSELPRILDIEGWKVIVALAE